jgi:threonine/homoserine/homoserine lactone efflux protein
LLEPSTVFAFFTASVLLALAPGPDNIFVLTQSLLQGRLAGILVVFGLCTGLIVHTSGVALGVATLLTASSLAFTALQLIGALYLLYLSFLSFQAGTSSTRRDNAKRLNTWQLYRRGIIMNVTNPKVTIFFLAFLPQFTHPENGGMAGQIIQLGLLFILATVLVFGAVALLAGSIGTALNAFPRTQIYLQRLAAIVFLFLALGLLFSNFPSGTTGS